MQAFICVTRDEQAPEGVFEALLSVSEGSLPRAKLLRLSVLGLARLLTGRGSSSADPWRSARVRADDRGVSVDGALRLRRDAIRSVRCECLRRGTVTVFLSRSERAIEVPGLFDLAVRFPQRREADKFLAAGKFKVASETFAAQFHRASQRWERNFAACVGAVHFALVFILLAKFGPAALPQIFCVTTIGLAFTALSAKRLRTMFVSVGEDGVYLRRWRSPHFVPRWAIRRIVQSGRDLVLHLTTNEVLVLHTAGSAEEPFEEFEHRLGPNGSDSEGGSRALSEDARSLECGGRAATDWLAALRRVDGGSYRQPVHLNTGRLRQTLANSALTVEVRAAAAFALQAREGTAATADLRRAAVTSASPRLRIALECLERGEDVETEACFSLLAKGEE